MKLYRIVDKNQNYTMHWTCDYSIIQHYLNNQAYYSSDYKNKDRIFVESMTIPDDIEPYKGTYRLSNRLMPHISVPLSVFETSSNLENTFKTIASFFDDMAYANLDNQLTNKLL